jgi:hypothetical protein
MTNTVTVQSLSPVQLIFAIDLVDHAVTTLNLCLVLYSVDETM